MVCVHNGMLHSSKKEETYTLQEYNTHLENVEKSHWDGTYFFPNMFGTPLLRSPLKCKAHYFIFLIKNILLILLL